MLHSARQIELSQSSWTSLLLQMSVSSYLWKLMPCPIWAPEDHFVWVPIKFSYHLLQALGRSGTQFDPNDPGRLEVPNPQTRAIQLKLPLGVQPEGQGNIELIGQYRATGSDPLGPVPPEFLCLVIGGSGLG